PVPLVVVAQQHLRHRQADQLGVGDLRWPPGPARAKPSEGMMRSVSISARSEARTNDLDGGENVGGEVDLPAAVANMMGWQSQKVTGLPRTGAPSFRAERRLGVGCPGVWIRAEADADRLVRGGRGGRRRSLRRRLPAGGGGGWPVVVARRASAPGTARL